MGAATSVARAVKRYDMAGAKASSCIMQQDGTEMLFCEKQADADSPVISDQVAVSDI